MTQSSSDRGSSDPPQTATTSEAIGASLLGRMNNVPFSRWHMRARVVMGSATFFDAFDALSLAFILPVLKVQWGLSIAQVGLLISIGYIGQLVGALVSGALADRIGRTRTGACAIGLMSIMAIVCVFTHNYAGLFACRLIQGIGVGGEVPVAAVYISEISPAHARGRFFILYELIFPLGLMATGQLGAWLVPTYGWQSMFVLGGASGLVIAALVLFLPESPRWLINQRRYADAERIIEAVEASTPLRQEQSPAPVPLPASTRVRWRELFAPLYRYRTLVVWVLWFCSYLVSNGLNNWLPTLYRSEFHLSLSSALRTASMTNLLQVFTTLACALLVDRWGRRTWAAGTYITAAVLLLCLAFGGTHSVVRVACLATLAYAVIGSTNVLLYLYTPEIYPTRMRAVGTGVATAWLRIGSSAGPLFVAALFAQGGLSRVFLVFAGVCLVAFVTSLLMIETRGRRLEDIAP